MSFEELQRLADLQLKSFTLQDELLSITNLMTQMMDDDCSIHLSFIIHNKTICNHNKQLEKVDKVLAPVEVVEVSPGQSFARYSPEKKPVCNKRYMQVLNEVSGLRIFDAILREKRLQLEEIQKEMEKLLLKASKTVDLPTQFLHHEHL